MLPTPYRRYQFVNRDRVEGLRSVQVLGKALLPNALASAVTAHKCRALRARVAMALSALSGDEQGIILGELHMLPGPFWRTLNAQRARARAESAPPSPQPRNRTIARRC